MRTLLDTSVAVALREGEAFIQRRAERLESPALLSILSVVELEGGVPVAREGAAVRRMILDELYETLDILPFDAREAAAYRRIVEVCGFSRSKIVDRLIAATAMAHDLVLATLNVGIFGPFEGSSWRTGRRVDQPACRASQTVGPGASGMPAVKRSTWKPWAARRARYSSWERLSW